MFILQMPPTQPSIPRPLILPGTIEPVFNFRPRPRPQAQPAPVIQQPPAPQPGFLQRTWQLYSDGLRIMGNGGPGGSY